MGGLGLTGADTIMGMPMKPLHLALLLGLAPLPALAEPALLGTEQAESRFGLLEVQEVDLEGFPGHQLTLDGVVVEGTEDAYVAIEQILPNPADPAMDLVLLSSGSGGNACPTLWQWVMVSEKEATSLDAFGTCSEGLKDLRVEAQTVVIEMASFDPAVEKAVYTLGGLTIEETFEAYSDAGATMAGPGDQVTRWVGQHPMMPFEDAGERLRFKAIMSEEQVFELAGRVTVASEAYEAGGFVLGEGFDPNSGGDVAGIWGIRVADGAPFAIFRTTGEPPQVFGLSDVDAPGAIRAEELPPAAQSYLEEPEE